LATNLDFGGDVFFRDPFSEKIATTDASEPQQLRRAEDPRTIREKLPAASLPIKN